MVGQRLTVKYTFQRREIDILEKNNKEKMKISVNQKEADRKTRNYRQAREMEHSTT